MEQGDQRRYQPYRQPTSPEAEPDPAGYELYDARRDTTGATPPPAPPRPRRAAPVRSPYVLPGAVAALVAVLAAVVAGGVVLLGATGPEEVDTPSGVIEVDDGSIRRQLEQTRDRYTAALKADDLASVGLEDTAHDRTAVAAFAFFLTDMIAATSFGIDDDTAVRYARDAAEYERLLLAGKPLGDDVEITFSEDRAFVYNGATGEGGYVNPSG